MKYIQESLIPGNKKKKSALKEDDLQKQCVKWFNQQYPNKLIHHSPNGGKRHIAAAVKFKAMGVVAGCPDLMIFSPVWVDPVKNLTMYYCGLAIELKVPGGVVSEHQKSFQDKLRSNGWLVRVAWSLDEFMFMVNDYFGKN